jgi:hypothetical protein
MCSLYTQSKSVDEVARELQIPLVFPEGVAPYYNPQVLRAATQ